MLKRLLVFSVLALVVYVFFVLSKIQVEVQKAGSEKETETKERFSQDGTQNVKIYNFAFTKYDTSGIKELEIQGESADMLAQIVQLENVIAKAYAEDIPVTITADQGQFDRDQSVVHLKKNVVATTDDGGRLLSDTLDIIAEDKVVKTDDFAEVIKGQMNLKGTGAIAKQQLQRVEFFKNIKVTFTQEAVGAEEPTTTVITCDGPLVINYDKSNARFLNNVISVDAQGVMKANQMDVFYNEESREVEKIYATGNVTLEQNKNKTYSDSILYLAKEGRVILEGDPEAFGLPSHTDIITAPL